MTDTDVPLGTRLGKYRITGRLGQGGMGVVYAGDDLRLGRAVAIKVLAAGLAGDAELLRRFVLEARAAARLNHPNVVTVHDVGQRDGTYFLVMELVGGGSVQTRLRERGPLPWPEATRIAADVCRGLAAAHAAGLIHRDVKPANILLAPDGTAKLADFGLTKAPALVPLALTQAGARLGTPQFMSPESCSGDRPDERTDLYSLGATYYTLLVGRPPFDGPDAVRILYEHCSAPVPDPRAAVPSLPPGCGQVIARAMAKARTERYRSAGDMLAALLALLGAPTAVAVPPPMPARPPLAPALPPRAVPPGLPRSGGRRKGLVLAALLGVILVGAGLWVASLFRAGPPPTQPPGPAPRPAAKDFEITLRARPVPLVACKGAARSVSAAGGRLAAAGADGTLTVWTLPGGTDPHVFHMPVGLSAVALSPDGKVAAAGGEGPTVFLWDVSARRALGVIPRFPGQVHALAFAPSGKQLAVASATDLQLLDYEPPASFPRRVRLLAQQYVVAAVAFSADGRRLAACTNQKEVHVWDLPGRKHTTAPRPLTEQLTAVALSPDGRRVAFGSYSGSLWVWEPDRGAAPRRLRGRFGSVLALAFAPGGSLVSAGLWGGPLNIHDLADGRTTEVALGVKGQVTGLCLTPDGRALAAACPDGTVRLWDVRRVAGPD